MVEESLVLIVEDAPLTRELLEDLLSSRGYKLLFAMNGEEALDIAVTSLPDVILLDVMMPGLDGFEVCRRVRSDDKLREVPIILLTALGDRTSRLKGFEVGADDFVTKPFDQVELLLRLRNITHLNRYRRLVEDREMLSKSLIGSVKLLIDILKHANPLAAKRAGRIQEIVGHIAIELGIESAWQLELAAMLSQIGFILGSSELPTNISGNVTITQHKHYLQASHKLLSCIPQLETIAGIIASCIRDPAKMSMGRGSAELGAQILWVAIDYDMRLSKGLSHATIVNIMRNESKHDLRILNVLARRDISKTVI